MIDKTAQIKPNTTPILFVNWTDEDFTGYWDGQPTLISTGETMWLPFWLAVHFAKHLTDREMNKLKINTDHFSREDYVAKCIGNKTDAVKEKQEDPLGIKALNENMKNEVAQTKKRGGRPKKAPVVEPVKKTDEEVFEGK